MSQETFWTTKSSTQKYKNPWIEVVEDVVINDLGKEEIYGVVRIGTGSCILPIDKEKFVYLTKQYRYGIRDFSIECAGGAIDPGEDAITSAKRELKEELGIEAGKWTDFGFIRAITGVVSHKEHLFLAEDFEPVSEAPYSEEEQIELVRIPFEEAVQLAMDSKIVHGPSAILILKAAIAQK